jgi:hypothetical protein
VRARPVGHPRAPPPRGSRPLLRCLAGTPAAARRSGRRKGDRVGPGRVRARRDHVQHVPHRLDGDLARHARQAHRQILATPPDLEELAVARVSACCRGSRRSTPPTARSASRASCAATSPRPDPTAARPPPPAAMRAPTVDHRARRHSPVQPTTFARPADGRTCGTFMWCNRRGRRLGIADRSCTWHAPTGQAAVRGRAARGRRRNIIHLHCGSLRSRRASRRCLRGRAAGRSAVGHRGYDARSRRSRRDCQPGVELPTFGSTPGLADPRELRPREARATILTSTVAVKGVLT